MVEDQLAPDVRASRMVEGLRTKGWSHWMPRLLGSTVPEAPEQCWGHREELDSAIG